MIEYVPAPGDIGLTQIHGNVGFLIRFGQWLNGTGFSNFEHAFVLVEDSMVVEAEPGGALLSSLGRYHGDTVVWIPCPPDLSAAVVAAAHKYVGVGYSFLDYVSLAARRFHLPIPGLKSYIASTHHLICSQLCDRAAMDGGWHLFNDGRDPGDVTPADLYRLVP